VGISISPSGVATGEASKPVEIPKGVKWDKPTTMVEAKPAAQIKNSGGYKAVVTFVGDGDTLNLGTADRKGINCRIDSIDAPETAHSGVDKKTGKSYSNPDQAYGQQAKKTLQDMVLNKEVTLRITRPTVNGSNHGRDACQIEISGKDVSHEMVKAGAAWVYQEYVRSGESTQINQEQRDAQKNKLGLWGIPGAQENPLAFRNRYRQ
jgi:endonuclease YncB( thermonuclease family)